MNLIPLGRAPTRPVKSSTKLESGLTHNPPFDSSHGTTEALSEGVSMPLQKRSRMGSMSAGASNSAPSTPPKIKTEEGNLKSAIKKAPPQATTPTYQRQHQQFKPKSLWVLTRSVTLDEDIKQRQVDEEVRNTLTQTSWQEPPPPQYVLQAIRYIMTNPLKADSDITSGLLRLSVAFPGLIRDNTISATLISMLRPVFTHTFKIRTNGVVVFLACALLHIGWDEVEDWPTDFVMAYVEDALGERSWCAHADTQSFVSNVLTAFCTDYTTDDTAEEKFDPVRLDEKANSNTSAGLATVELEQFTESLALRKRYRDLDTRANIKYVIMQTMWEHIPMTTGNSASDTAVRSLIKTMMATCRWSEVRLKAMSCMEFWLGNFMKHAKSLLRLILRQMCAQDSLSPEDLETWTMLLDFKYKGRSHQVESVKEEIRNALQGATGQELIRAGLNHIINTELNPNEHKNPYHLDLMEQFLLSLQDNPAVEFGQLIQACVVDAALHMIGSTVSPPLAPVVLVVKRWVRHLGKRIMVWNKDIIFGLLKDSPHLAKLTQKQEQHQHLHIPPGGRNIPTMWLQMLTEIVCNVMMATAIDAKEFEDIRICKFQIGEAHAYTLRWFHSISVANGVGAFFNNGDGEACVMPFGIVPIEGLRICIARLLFLDPPPSYAMDTTSQEFDSGLIQKVVEHGVPIMEAGLMALLEINLPPKMLLILVGDYVSRAVDLSRFYPDACIVKNPDVVVKIFNLSRFCETNNSQVLKLSTDIPLAWTQSFWTCCMIVVMLACCNPRILALVVWDSMPVIRALLEMCISQHYTFPPPNYSSHSEPSSERLLRLSIQADQADEDCVLAWEKETLIVQDQWSKARGTNPLRKEESEYAGWLMRLNYGPSQPARNPPPDVLQQLRGVNDRFGLGMKLAGSREPDYLSRMVGTHDDAPWVDRLLREVPEIMNALPASTLCARYCRSIKSSANAEAEGVAMSAKAKAIAAEVRLADANVKKKLLGYLETVMQGRPGEPSQKFQQVRGIFEYFLVRLAPSSSSSIDSTISATGTGMTIEETKVAMDALFQGELRWSDVLVQTVVLSPDTGFLWSALQWIKNFIMFENDVKWIGSSLDFLLKVEGGAEGDQALEQSLLTIASVLTRRLFVFDWLARERKLVFQRLVDRVQSYFAKQDSVMEDVASKSKSVDRGSSAASAALRALASSKVQVELSTGDVLNTFPEILRLAVLVMAIGDVSKQDGSTWSRLFQDAVQNHPGQPKRLQNGSALLHCDPLLSNDIQFRLRIVQGCKDAEVVKVALDGLNLVQTIELTKNAFGLDLQVSQLVHAALLVALENEAEQSVPVHLESSAARQLMALLKYYADQGGESSLKALEVVKARFGGGGSMLSSPVPTKLPTQSRRLPAVLPDFFQLASA
ncbi:Integrator complex subunit 1 [Mortierella sp. NVP41]|nr:Integrator complex subunit 1 [Mortierella sp. NVP41]